MDEKQSEKEREFWRAKRELERAQAEFDNADKDHIEVAIYRLAAAEKFFSIAQKLCKIAE